MSENLQLPTLTEIVSRMRAATVASQMWAPDNLKKDEGSVETDMTLSKLLNEYEDMKRAREQFERVVKDIPYLIERIASAEGDAARQSATAEKMAKEVEYLSGRIENLILKLENEKQRADVAENKIRMLKEVFI